MKKKSMALNAFLNGLRGILSIIFPLVTFPYVSRILSVRGIGKYNFSNSYVSYFVLLASLGVSTYAVREGAEFRNNKRKIGQFASEVFTINICSTLVSYVLLFISLVAFIKLHSYLSCILIFSIQIFFTTIGTDWIYTIYEDYAYITVRSIIFQLISIVLLFIFVRESGDYLNYAAITVFSAVGSNLLNYFHAKKICRIKLIWHFNWKRHIIPILVIFASNVAITIYVNSDITLLGLMKNNYVVGIYSVSSKIYSMVQNFTNSILAVTIPRLAMLYGKKRTAEYKNVLSKVINSMILFIIPTVTGLFVLSKNAILIISSSKYIRATNSLKILSFALLFSLMSTFLSGCVLIPIKHEKDVLKGTLASAFINIILNILLIPVLSENAAAISTILAEVVMMSFCLYYAWNIVKNIFISRNFVKNIIDSVAGSLAICIVCIIIMNFCSNIWFQTILCITLSVIVYALILMILGNKIFFNFIRGVKSRVFK